MSSPQVFCTCLDGLDPECPAHRTEPMDLELQAVAHIVAAWEEAGMNVDFTSEAIVSRALSAVDALQRWGFLRPEVRP